MKKREGVLFPFHSKDTTIYGTCFLKAALGDSRKKHRARFWLNANCFANSNLHKTAFSRTLLAPSSRIADDDVRECKDAALIKFIKQRRAFAGDGRRLITQSVNAAAWRLWSCEVLFFFSPESGNNGKTHVGVPKFSFHSRKILLAWALAENCCKQFPASLPALLLSCFNRLI